MNTVNKHPDYVHPEKTHYYYTPKEMEAMTGKGPGTHDNDFAACGNGSFHFKRTRNKSDVTCEKCRAKLSLPLLTL